MRANDARHPARFVIVGAGASGLMAGRELARAGKTIVILEARERAGGRIWPLPTEEFGYSAEGGAEFVHGEAPLTQALMREAGLSFSAGHGERMTARAGKLSIPDESMSPDGRFHRVLAALETDLPIAQFLDDHFAGAQYAGLRRSITRMVEGYDAADPRRASTFALRDEWMSDGIEHQGRIAEGYGALIDFLASDCRKHGGEIRLEQRVTGIEAKDGSVMVRCGDGATEGADAAIVTVPLPLLSEIALPASLRRKIAAASDIGFGNVIKFVLKFRAAWWLADRYGARANLFFFFSDEPVPTWWTQYPENHPVLTGWLAGPRCEKFARLSPDELIDTGLSSLAAIFQRPKDELRQELIAARAFNWANDPLARGAYSYATPETRAAQARLREPGVEAIYFSGEALYSGPDMGTVEAALASGLEAARMILAGGP